MNIQEELKKVDWEIEITEQGVGVFETGTLQDDVLCWKLKALKRRKALLEILNMTSGYTERYRDIYRIAMEGLGE
jgi:hypothetical protein